MATSAHLAFMDNTKASDNEIWQDQGKTRKQKVRKIELQRQHLSMHAAGYYDPYHASGIATRRRQPQAMIYPLLEHLGSRRAHITGAMLIDSLVCHHLVYFFKLFSYLFSYNIQQCLVTYIQHTPITIGYGNGVCSLSFFCTQSKFTAK